MHIIHIIPITFTSFGICLVACIRSEPGIVKFFLHGLCRSRKRKRTVGMGMGVLNNQIQVMGWRPKLPTMLYKTLKALITDCWAADPLDRPDFDQIVMRLNSEIRDEVMWKPEPVFVNNENFLLNTIDYDDEDAAEDEKDEKLVILSQRMSELVEELQETLPEENLDLLDLLKTRRASLEEEHVKIRSARRNTLKDLSDTVEKKKEKQAKRKSVLVAKRKASGPEEPLPDMFKGLVQAANDAETKKGDANDKKQTTTRVKFN